MSVNEFHVNPATVEAVQDVASAAHQVRRALARRTGLSDVELSALEHLVSLPSSPTELARLLGVSTAASTGLVDRLERHGHVERHPHPTDRRRTDVHVTASGRGEIVQHLRPMLTALVELDSSLTEAEREVVERYLRGVVAAFGLVTDPGRDN